MNTQSTSDSLARLHSARCSQGIGGMDLGLERAGMKCRWQVEIDPYCLALLSASLATRSEIRRCAASWRKP